MKRTTRIAIFVSLVLAALAYFSYTTFGPRTADVLGGLFAKPCTVPIEYSLGTFDPRFGISKAEFLKAVEEGGAVWERALGHPLFTYATGSDFKVNLVYGDAAKTLATLKVMGIDIHESEATYASLKSKYADLKGIYDAKNTELDSRKAEYAVKQAAYEKQVAYWNGRGGAPPDAYAELVAERTALESMGSEIAQDVTAVNSVVEQINATVSVLNLLVGELNLKVDAYNRVGNAGGSAFTEGEWWANNGTQGIDIFAYTDREKLVRVLAHEWGHALGLEHVADTKSIMYKINEGTSLTLTGADKAELALRCDLSK